MYVKVKALISKFEVSLHAILFVHPNWKYYVHNALTHGEVWLYIHSQ